MDNQPAEVRVKLVIDGNAVKAMDAVTKATKQASDAEAEYQRKLHTRARQIEEQKRLMADLQKMGAIEGPRNLSFGGQVGQAAARILHQRAVQAELIRMGVVEGPKAPAAPKTVQQEASERAAAIARQKAVQAELLRMGAIEGPKPRPRGPGVGMQAAEGLMGMAGLSGAVGVGGLVAMAGHMGIQYANQVNDINRQPFLTDAQRKDQMRLATPILGSVIQGSRSVIGTLIGADRSMAQIQQEKTLGHVTATGEGQIKALRANMGYQADLADARADVFQGHYTYDKNRNATFQPGLRLDRAGSFDRGSVTGRRLFEEDQKTLAARQQLTIATKERAATEKAVGIATKRVVDAEKDVEKARRDYDVQVRGRQALSAEDRSGNNRSLMNAAGDEAIAEQRYRDALARQKSATEARLQAQHGDVAAQQRLAQSQAGVVQANLSVAEGREARVTGQAERFGMMGVEGRMQGRMAVQLLQQMGIDNAPADLIQAASAYAPETVRAMSQGAGEKELGVASQIAGQEFDQTSLKDARRKTDEAREAATGAEEKAFTTGLDKLSGPVVAALTGLVGALEKEINSLRVQVERDGQTRILNPG